MVAEWWRAIALRLVNDTSPSESDSTTQHSHATLRHWRGDERTDLAVNDTGSDNLA